MKGREGGRRKRKRKRKREKEKGKGKRKRKKKKKWKKEIKGEKRKVKLGLVDSMLMISYTNKSSPTTKRERSRNWASIRCSHTPLLNHNLHLFFLSSKTL